MKYLFYLKILLSLYIKKMNKNVSEPNEHIDESGTSTTNGATDHPDDSTDKSTDDSADEPIIAQETLTDFYNSFKARDYIIDGVIVLLIAIVLAILLGTQNWLFFIGAAILLIIANLGAFVWSWVILKQKYGKFWTKRTLLNMLIPGSSFITVSKFYKIM